MALKNTGIYVIRNILTGKCYVGQSVNLLSRRRAHYAELRHKRHTNPYLQKAWSKVGEENFEYAVLELCEVEQLNSREVFWFQKIGEQKLYNLFLGKNDKPHRISEETRQKRSIALAGKVFSEQHRANLSKALTGRQLTPEHKAATSAGWQRRPKKPRPMTYGEKQMLRNKLFAENLERTRLPPKEPVAWKWN